jgi:hypothetical protein
LLVSGGTDTIETSRAIGAVGYDTSHPSNGSINDLETSTKANTAFSTAVDAGNATAGPDPVAPNLQAVIAAWPTLPASLRAGILAIVQSAGGKE